MDAIDLKILAALEENGRISFTELGEKIGLSKTPCWTRVKELEASGVIEGYSARLSPQELSLGIRALVHVVVGFDRYQAFEDAIIQHRSVRCCHAVTGEYDYILEVLAPDISALDELLRLELSRLPGVSRFNTSITTRMIKEAGSYCNMLPP